MLSGTQKAHDVVISAEESDPAEPEPPSTDARLHSQPHSTTTRTQSHAATDIVITNASPHNGLSGKPKASSSSSSTPTTASFTDVPAGSGGVAHGGANTVSVHVPASYHFGHEDGSVDYTSPYSHTRSGPAASPALAGMSSSEHEGAIVEQLCQLAENCQNESYGVQSPIRIILRSLLREQTGAGAVLITSILLIISCVLYPVSQTIVCSVFFLILYTFCTSLQCYLFWCRVTESKHRTVSVVEEVTARWGERIREMPARRSQTLQERRRVFLESFAFLPAKAFRMVAAVDNQTLRLKHIHKSLLIKGAKRLDEATLKVRRYMEPHSIAKLIDVMRITLTSDAIVLKPLTDRAKPPRLPNLLLTNSKRFIEEEDTTDESDQECDSRTELGGGNSISVAHDMEFFVHRVFLLLWVLGMVLTIGAGVLFYFLVAAPLGEGVFLDPAVALLGLLPVNAIVLHRFLVLYANAYLDKLFHYMVAKRTHHVDDKLPRFSTWSTLKTVLRILLHIQPSNGSRNPLVYSSSLVDGFGMATVVAVLDQPGIVTDMVLLPFAVLMLRVNPRRDSSSSDEDDDVVGFLTEKSKLEARERKREMKRQVKRKQFQEERFLELKLTLCARDDLAVEFGDRKEARRHQNHLNPISLCILLHVASRGLQYNLETWTEPFRFIDRTLRWSRALHWIPRACSFADRVTEGYCLIARIFQIDTKSKTGYRNAFPEHMCSLLAEDVDGLLHLFSIGTPYLVTRHCTTHWTGDTVDEFDTQEKQEVLYMGKHQWEEGSCLETVALSHRLLPERYRRYVDTIVDANAAMNVDPHGSAGPSKTEVKRQAPRRCAEYFFRDGVEVNSESAKARRRRRVEKSTKAAQWQSQRCYGGGSDGEDVLMTAKEPHSVEEDGEVTAAGGVPASAMKDRLSLRSSGGAVRGIAQVRSASAPHGSTAAQYASLPRAVSSGEMPSDSQPGELEADDCLTMKSFVYLMATTAHTFLGLVGVRDSVRPHVQTAMSILDAAGVRCMFFCPENERQTKSFGSRVGLETDWNCCISLKEDAVKLDAPSIRAQLPYGIKSIRKHILHVDPIPLQVNLFSHANGVSTRAMLSILQDNHEVVVAVGSVFNHANVRSFVQSDVALGTLPTRRGPNADKDTVLRHTRIVEPSDLAATNSLNRDIPLYRNVAELIGCSCSLRAPPTPSVLPILVTMVRQARLRLSGIGNCIEFIMHASFLIATINCISLVVGAPLLMGPTMTVVELNLIIPILALSCTYTAYSGMDPMRTMPSRHNYFVRLAIFRHSAVVWCLRYLPSVGVLLALGITASEKLCHEDVLDLIKISTADCMVASQGYVTLTFNYWLMVHCWTHMSRHHPISLRFSLRLGHGKPSIYLFSSLRWVGVNLAVTVISLIVVLSSTPWSSLPSAFMPSIPHLLVSLLFPIFNLALDFPIKRWRERRFTNMQKFRKLSYGTRLGMHSPRGDYEPEGVTYNTTSTGAGGAGAGSAGGDDLREKNTVGVGKRISEMFYRYTTMRRGKLELNCVCCDHVGGNYASYHVSANI